jgi:NADPH:quinone reductase-like Zn-dependent oxidoreductase
MLAARCFERSGDLDKLRLCTVDRPVPRQGYAVVRVFIAAGNGLDFKVLPPYKIKSLFYFWQVMSGDFPLNLEYPLTLGVEFSGVVESLDVEETDYSLSVGDKVCGISWDPNSSQNDPITLPGGAFAEYILFSIQKLCFIPGGVSMKEAAAVGLAGLTASQLLKDCSKTSPPSRILILGGSSVVGLILIQLAKLTGAWVATTASSRSMKFVSQFGADLVINYEEKDWDQLDYLKYLGAVIDTVGEPDALLRSINHKVISSSEAFSSAVSPALPPHRPGHHITSLACSYKIKNDRDEHQHLLRLLESGKLMIPIDQQFSFSEEGIRALVRYQQRRKSLGKNLVLFGELATYHGGCSCGGVIFEVNGQPEASLLCHCQGCQQLLSGVFAPLALYPQITIIRGRDLLVSYGSPLAMNRSHFFCRVCGQPLYLRHPDTDSFAVLPIVLGDFPFRPEAHVHYDQRRCLIPDQLPKCPGWLVGRDEEVGRCTAKATGAEEAL